MRSLQSAIGAVMVSCGLMGAAHAGAIPYPNPGTQNPVIYNFTAATTGDVIAYFDGTGASYNETLGLDVNGVGTGITGLPNHSSSIGQSLDLGHANAGDTLTFFIDVQTTNTFWYSNPALNGDGANHVYSTAYTGGGSIPAGTYVGFEDLPASQADWNYTDEQFVFTNTMTATVPEPATLALLGAALAGLGLLRRQRKV